MVQLQAKDPLRTTEILEFKRDSAAEDILKIDREHCAKPIPPTRGLQLTPLTTVESCS
jgi:hypothetical protein